MQCKNILDSYFKIILLCFYSNYNLSLEIFLLVTCVGLDMNETFNLCESIICITDTSEQREPRTHGHGSMAVYTANLQEASPG